MTTTVFGSLSSALAFVASSLVLSPTGVVSVPGVGSSEAVLVVTTSADEVADDGLCSLREAVRAAHTAEASGQASGECGAGHPSGTTTISSSFSLFLRAPLEPITTSIELVGTGLSVSSGEPAPLFDISETGSLLVRHALLENWGGGSGVVNRGTLVFDDVRLTGVRDLSGAGGGVVNFGVFEANDSFVSESTTTGDGGGIYNAGFATLTNSGIFRSSGTRGGGIFNSGALEMNATTVATSFAAEAGGGLFNSPTGLVTIVNSTFSRNVAADRGGGVHQEGAATISFATLTANESPVGSGIAGFGPAAQTGISASIVASNLDGPDLEAGGGDHELFGSEGYNIVGEVVGTTAFEEATSVSGVTEPGLLQFDNLGAGPGGHLPARNSLAIDFVGEEIPRPSVDQRTIARPAGDGADAGAVESTCGATSWNVHRYVELFAAIDCFNRVTTPGSYSIALLSDVESDVIRPIGNELSGVALTVDGRGRSITAIGPGTIFTVEPGTEVTIVDLSLLRAETSSGSGISNLGSLEVRDSVIRGHETGVDNTGQLSVVRSTVESNRSGGVSTRGALATTVIESSTISNNYDAFGGGGLSVDSGSLIVRNSTISNNGAGRGGGGVLNFRGDVELEQVTLAGNRLGGSIYNSGAESRTRLTASIVFDGDARQPEIDQAATVETFTSGGSNVIGRVRDGSMTIDLTDSLGVDPALQPLGDNGGSTLTHALGPGSVAVDAVDAPSLDQDQRGRARPIGHSGDAGAFEAGDVDADGIADPVDNCVTIANPDQADADVDGIGDLCDSTVDPPDPGVPAAFEFVAPARFADSRDLPTFDGRFRASGPRAAGSEWEIDIAGRGRVPTDAVAAIVNVTIVGGSDPGFATVHPCGQLPVASSVNYSGGEVQANEVIAKLSSFGTVCIYTLTEADVIVDVVGFTTWVSPYRPLVPARFADSRDESTVDDRFSDTGQRRSGSTWEVQIAGRSEVPTTAIAATVNVTVVGGSDPGFLTVFPCGDVPLASSLNFAPGQVTPNELVATLSSRGTICIYALSAAHVVVDVVGYLERTESYAARVPSRLADSRSEPTVDNRFRATGRRAADSVWEVAVGGRANVPRSATMAVINVTVTEPSGPGFLTVWDCQGRPPTTSSLNYVHGTTRPNELIVRLSPTGSLCVYALTPTHVLVDLVGHDGS